jgi:hexosaminidase
LGVEEVVLCAGKETTFEFFENVIKEVANLFPSEYLHIGGDECPKIKWKSCSHCQKRIHDENLLQFENHSPEERLQSYFIQRVEKILNSLGKKLVGWDEILEGGLAPSSTVMSWRGEEGGIRAAMIDHDVIMTPVNYGLYLDTYQGDPKVEPVANSGYTTLEKSYGYNPVSYVLLVNQKSCFIKGVQANVWSEFMYTTDLMEFRRYPRVLALAEIGWTALQVKDYQSFQNRVIHNFIRLDFHQINYFIPQPELFPSSCDFVAFCNQTQLQFKNSQNLMMA